MKRDIELRDDDDDDDSRATKRPRLGEALLARLGGAPGAAPQYGIGVGTQSVTVHDGVSSGNRVREDGYVVNAQNQPTTDNQMPFGDEYVKEWFTLQTLLEMNPDYRAATMLAGLVGVQPAEIITDSSLGRVERVEREFHATLQTARKKFAMSSQERQAAVLALQLQLDQELVMQDRLRDMNVAMQRTVRRWHWLASMTGYPTTTAGPDTLDRTQWKTSGEEDMPVPFWHLSINVRPQYKWLASGKGLSWKKIKDDFSSDTAFWRWNAGHEEWPAQLQRAFVDRWTSGRVPGDAMSFLVADYLTLRDFVLVTHVKLKPDPGLCPGMATDSVVSALATENLPTLLENVHAVLARNGDLQTVLNTSSIALDRDGDKLPSVFNPSQSQDEGSDDDDTVTYERDGKDDYVKFLIKNDAAAQTFLMGSVELITGLKFDAFLFWLRHLRKTRVRDKRKAILNALYELAAGSIITHINMSEDFTLVWSAMIFLNTFPKDFTLNFKVPIVVETTDNVSSLVIAFSLTATKNPQSTERVTVRLSSLADIKKINIMLDNVPVNSRIVYANILVSAVMWRNIFHDSDQLVFILENSVNSFDDEEGFAQKCPVLATTSIRLNALDNKETSPKLFYFFLRELIRSTFLGQQSFRTERKAQYKEGVVIGKSILLPWIPTANRYVFRHEWETLNYYLTEINAPDYFVNDENATRKIARKTHGGMLEVLSYCLIENGRSSATAVEALQYDELLLNLFDEPTTSIARDEAIAAAQEELTKATNTVTESQKANGSYFYGASPTSLETANSNLQNATRQLAAAKNAALVKITGSLVTEGALNNRKMQLKLRDAITPVSYVDSEGQKMNIIALDDIVGVPFLKLLTTMCVFVGHFYKEARQELDERIGKTRGALQMADKRLANVVSNDATQDVRDIFTLMRDYYVPSRAWEMQVAVTGRMQLQAWVVAAIATAYADVQAHMPHLRGVPCDVLTGYTWTPPSTAPVQVPTHAYIVAAACDPPGASGAATALATAFLGLVAACAFDARLSFPDQYKSAVLYKRGPLLKLQAAQALAGFRAERTAAPFGAAAGAGDAWRVKAVAPAIRRR